MANLDPLLKKANSLELKVIEPIKPNVFECLALRNSANLRILNPNSGAKRMML
jgi:hypothetical protein